MQYVHSAYTDYLKFSRTVPSMHTVSLPVHTVLVRQVKHFLILLPWRRKPSLHFRAHLSPLVATPSSPSEHSIVPLSGADSGGHVATERKYTGVNF